MPAAATTSAVDEIAALGSEINANHYKIVRLAAQYDTDREWHAQGLKSPAHAIAHALDIHTSTAHEWVRVGHALSVLPLVDTAFASNELSYAKTRIVTRWADPSNEHELLELAYERSANRLTAAIAAYLAGDETDAERELRLHDARSVTVHTDGDGLVVIRAALPPEIGKRVVAAVDSIVRQVAATPLDNDVAEVGSDRPESSADDSELPKVIDLNAACTGDSSADDSPVPIPIGASMADQLRVLKQRWQPEDAADDHWIPSFGQQRADAFMLLFLGVNIEVVTEVIIHVRGDGNTFDDGTPITTSALCRGLDESFIRLMLHDIDRSPVDASNRRRHPTTRQKRVVMENHDHECVDCQSTDLLELDHNPPFEKTGHTVTSELEPRCAPCHRARHRTGPQAVRLA